jgi:hypothetical protein
MRRPELDQIGAAASTACAVHCAIIPIALSLSAGGVVSFLGNQAVEWGLVIVSGLLGTIAAWRGHRRHGNAVVAAALAAAAIGLVLATFLRPSPDAYSADETIAWLSGRGRRTSPLLPWLFPLLGAAVAVAHVVNLRLCRSCKGCETRREPNGARAACGVGGTEA